MLGAQPQQLLEGALLLLARHAHLLAQPAQPPPRVAQLVHRVLRQARLPAHRRRLARPLVLRLAQRAAHHARVGEQAEPLGRELGALALERTPRADGLLEHDAELLGTLPQLLEVLRDRRVDERLVRRPELVEEPAALGAVQPDLPHQLAQPHLVQPLLGEEAARCECRRVALLGRPPQVAQ